MLSITAKVPLVTRKAISGTIAPAAKSRKEVAAAT